MIDILRKSYPGGAIFLLVVHTFPTIITVTNDRSYSRLNAESRPREQKFVIILTLQYNRALYSLIVTSSSHGNDGARVSLSLFRMDSRKDGRIAAVAFGGKGG